MEAMFTKTIRNGYNGKISEQSKQVQAVFDFINSDDGQKSLKKLD